MQVPNHRRGRPRHRQQQVRFSARSSAPRPPALVHRPPKPPRVPPCRHRQQGPRTSPPSTPPLSPVAANPAGIGTTSTVTPIPRTASTSGPSVQLINRTSCPNRRTAAIAVIKHRSAPPSPPIGLTYTHSHPATPAYASAMTRACSAHVNRARPRQARTSQRRRATFRCSRARPRPIAGRRRPGRTPPRRRRPRAAPGCRWPRRPRRTPGPRPPAARTPPPQTSAAPRPRRDRGRRSPRRLNPVPARRRRRCRAARSSPAGRADHSPPTCTSLKSRARARRRTPRAARRSASARCSSPRAAGTAHPVGPALLGSRTPPPRQPAPDQLRRVDARRTARLLAHARVR